MALRFCDSMDAYRVGDNVLDVLAAKYGTCPRFGYTTSGEWTTAGGFWSIPANEGRFGGMALRYQVGGINSGSQTYGGNPCAVNKIGGWNTTLGVSNYIGFWYRYVSGVQPIARGLVSISGNFGQGTAPNPLSVSEQYGQILAFDAQGRLTAVRGYTTTVIATGTKVLTDGQWHWIEFAWMGANTATGAAQLYVDQELQFNVQNVQTLATDASIDGTVTVWSQGGPTATGSVMSYQWFDDIIMWDSEGTDFNTFPVGPRRIAFSQPSASGSLTQLTPSSASPNWQIAAQGYSGTATLTDNGQSGLGDLYAMTALPYPPRAVDAVVTNVHTISPGGVVDFTISNQQQDQATQTTGQSVTKQAAFYADSSGQPWTAATLNGIQSGQRSI